MLTAWAVDTIAIKTESFITFFFFFIFILILNLSILKLVKYFIIVRISKLKKQNLSFLINQIQNI
jgi:antibiotic biosynthesis monooxygenase (ABM) superfamily enzyme